MDKNEENKNIPWILILTLSGVVVARLIFKFQFNSYEFGLLAVIILFLHRDKLSTLFEVIKFGDFEIRTKINEIKKDQRIFCIVGPKGIIHSTFREQKFDLIEYEPKNLKTKFRLEPKPDYLEVRSNLGSIFQIILKNGIYECEANGLVESENNKIIVEAYFKGQ